MGVLVADIMAFEDGTLEFGEVVDLFQGLIDSGMAWSLQGSYGRTAVALIEAGHCTDPRPPHHFNPELIGTRCECGALYDPTLPGYGCAR